MSINVRSISPDTDGVNTLITLSETYMSTLYPAESNHFEPLDSFKLPNAFFVGGFIDEQLLAIGAFKIMQNNGVYGEIKRVFVHPDARGKGLAKAIMQTLENESLNRGVTVVRLETGTHQPEALRLYDALNYHYREPFGVYQVDPLSVFMEKQLVSKS